MKKFLLLAVLLAGTAFANPTHQVLLTTGEEVDVLTLSGHSNTATNSFANAEASFRVDNNGNMYEGDNGSFSQIDVTADWLRPTSSAPGTYEVRYTGATGDTGSITATTAENTWHPLSSGDWTITVTDTTITATTRSATFTIEIRLGNSGGADETGSYTLTADRED